MTAIPAVPGCEHRHVREERVWAYARPGAKVLTCKDCGASFESDGSFGRAAKMSPVGDIPNERRRNPGGRKRAFPSREYLIAEYRRVKAEIKHEPTQDEFAAEARSARARPGDPPMVRSTVTKALSDFKLNWPPE